MSKKTRVINGFALGFALTMTGFASLEGVSFGSLALGAGCYLLVRMGAMAFDWLLEPVSTYEPEEDER